MKIKTKAHEIITALAKNPDAEVEFFIRPTIRMIVTRGEEIEEFDLGLALPFDETVGIRVTFDENKINS